MQLVHQSRPVVPRDRFVRLPDVLNHVGCGKSKLYEMMANNEFPKPVRAFSSRCVTWVESDVLQWVQDRIAAAQDKGAEVQQ